MTLRDRARSAGIGAPIIAAVLGASPTGIYRWLDDERPNARAIIAAWEIMTPEQRRQWLDALGVAAERPRRGRPRKASSDARRHHQI